MSLASAVQSIVDNEETHLNLKGNFMGAEGATALATALHVNTTLTSLDLWENKIGVNGAMALATALKVNTTLTFLDLNGNNIGESGAPSLATALLVNTTLRSLEIRNNSFGDDGTTRTIDRMVKRNVDLYDAMFWQAVRHGDFPRGMHDLIVTTLLCNKAVGEKKIPRLPLVVWDQVFSFYRRKDFCK